jgi:hypothetical protein
MTTTFMTGVSSISSSIRDMVFVRQIKRRPANPVAKATESGGRRCPKARDQGVTFAAMLAGPSLVRRANLRKGHAMPWIARSGPDGRHLAISAHDRMRCLAMHFDAARHNTGALQHFIRAPRLVNAAVTRPAAIWSGYFL